MTPYYSKDGITLYCGDNVATMQQCIPDASIDLVVTSPPYDSLRTYGGHSWDFEGVAQQLWRVIKPGGVVVWVVADATIDGSETGTSFRQALRFMDIGFRLHDTMVWEKGASGACGSNLAYWQEWEFMLVLSKGKPKSVTRLKRKALHPGQSHTSGAKQDGMKSRVITGTLVTGDECFRGNVWRYPIGTPDGNRTAHPAPFPEALARDHILSWSNEGDIVLDPFNGSGTTAKMAKLMGRKAIGIEINEDYCRIAVERLKQGVFNFAEADA